MTEIFHQLLAWVAENPVWTGLAIFLVAMAESVAIVGLIVPGVVIMFGIGALIAADAVSLQSAIAWAVAGAVAGDGLSFYIGYRYREELTRVWPFTRYPASLDKGILFFDRYGGKSVAFGRFFGPVRAVIPLVAGMMGMNPGRFAVANILSALAWAPAYLLPGMLFGASLELASEVAFRLVALILIAVSLVWLSAWLARRAFRSIQPRAARLVQRVLAWGELHPRLREIAAALADPAHPEAKGLSMFAGLLVLTIGLFALLTGAVLEGAGFPGVDRALLDALQSLRTPWADALMVSVTQLTDLAPFIGFSLGMLALFALLGHRRTAQHWAAGILFCLLAAPLLKLGLQVPRPEVVNQVPTSFAFPSGHVLRATVAFGFLAVIVARTLDLRHRWVPYAMATVLVTAVALSRLYLGVHWLSDIFGSIALGLAWVAALGLAYHRHTHPEAHWRGVTAAGVTLLVAITVPYGLLTRDQALLAYGPVEERWRMDRTEWADAGWSRLPAFRQDTRRRQDHPFNVQYAGRLDDLAQGLESSGWRQAPPFRWSDLVRFLSPGITLVELPILPQVHDGRHESLVLFRETPSGGRLVLRLWVTGVELLPGDQPLWVGNVTAQVLESAADLVTYAATAGETAEAVQSLRDDAGLPLIERRVGGRRVILMEMPKEAGGQEAPQRMPS